MTIRVDCACGKVAYALDVFAGGHVKCEVCGRMLSVPEPEPVEFDKIRFSCPHCQTRVVARKASVGKWSTCPACSESYNIPESDRSPEPDVSPASLAHRKRIEIGSDDIILLSDAAENLERKTELPCNDDTVRPPTRPVRPSALDGDPLPMTDYLLPPHEETRPAPVNQPTKDDSSTDSRANKKPVEELPFAETLPPIVDYLPPSPPPRPDDQASHDSQSRIIVPPQPQRPVHTPAEVRPLVEPSELVPPVRMTEQNSTAEPPIARATDLPAIEYPDWSFAPMDKPTLSQPIQPGFRASMRFFEGLQAGEIVEISVRNFLVGRERDCHFRPENRSVSHHHCVLKTDAHAVRIRDLGSRNGTFVNGHRIHSEVTLHHSDSVRIGDLRFTIEIPNDLYAGDHSSETELSFDQFIIF